MMQFISHAFSKSKGPVEIQIALQPIETSADFANKFSIILLKKDCS